ncbi:MAG: hypothetical protein VYD19_07870 [Myxococcota bacterium]|nr:hypothetical protein [Myxococcota bacterium]
MNESSPAPQLRTRKRWYHVGAHVSIVIATGAASLHAWDQGEALLEQLFPALQAVAFWVLYRHGGWLSRAAATLYGVIAATLYLDLGFPPEGLPRPIPMIAAAFFAVWSLCVLSGRTADRA